MQLLATFNPTIGGLMHVRRHAREDQEPSCGSYVVNHLGTIERSYWQLLLTTSDCISENPSAGRRERKKLTPTAHSLPLFVISTGVQTPPE